MSSIRNNLYTFIDVLKRAQDGMVFSYKGNRFKFIRKSIGDVQTDQLSIIELGNNENPKCIHENIFDPHWMVMHESNYCDLEITGKIMNEQSDCFHIVIHNKDNIAKIKKTIDEIMESEKKSNSNLADESITKDKSKSKKRDKKDSAKKEEVTLLDYLESTSDDCPFDCDDDVDVDFITNITGGSKHNDVIKSKPIVKDKPIFVDLGFLKKTNLRREDNDNHVYVITGNTYPIRGVLKNNYCYYTKNQVWIADNKEVFDWIKGGKCSWIGKYTLKNLVFQDCSGVDEYREWITNYCRQRDGGTNDSKI